MTIPTTTSLPQAGLQTAALTDSGGTQPGPAAPPGANALQRATVFPEGLKARGGQTPGQQRGATSDMSQRRFPPPAGPNAAATGASSSATGPAPFVGDFLVHKVRKDGRPAKTLVVSTEARRFILAVHRDYGYIPSQIAPLLGSGAKIPTVAGVIRDHEAGEVLGPEWAGRSGASYIAQRSEAKRPGGDASGRPAKLLRSELSANASPGHEGGTAGLGGITRSRAVPASPLAAAQPHGQPGVQRIATAPATQAKPSLNVDPASTNWLGQHEHLKQFREQGIKRLTPSPTQPFKDMVMGTCQYKAGAGAENAVAYFSRQGNQLQLVRVDVKAAGASGPATVARRAPQPAGAGQSAALSAAHPGRPKPAAMVAARFSSNGFDPEQLPVEDRERAGIILADAAPHVVQRVPDENHRLGERSDGYAAYGIKTPQQHACVAEYWDDSLRSLLLKAKDSGEVFLLVSHTAEQDLDHGTKQMLRDFQVAVCKGRTWVELNMVQNHLAQLCPLAQWLNVDDGDEGAARRRSTLDQKIRNAVATSGVDPVAALMTDPDIRAYLVVAAQDGSTEEARRVELGLANAIKALAAVVVAEEAPAAPPACHPSDSALIRQLSQAWPQGVTEVGEAGPCEALVSFAAWLGTTPFGTLEALTRPATEEDRGERTLTWRNRLLALSSAQSDYGRLEKRDSKEMALLSSALHKLATMRGTEMPGAT